MRLVRLMVVVGCLAGLMSGCGGDEEETATAPAGSSPSTTSAEETPAPETAKASPDSTDRPDTDGDGSPDEATFEGSLGDSFILVGQSGFKEPAKEAVKMTVLKVIGPFKGFNVDKGNEIIGVKVRFEGVGEEPFDDPQPHADLTLESGAKGKQTSLIVVQGKDPCDNKRLKLAKGKKVNSCLAYEVKKGDEPVKLEYNAASGYGDTGVWALK